MFFFFNDTATTEIYTLSLHDALPIFPRARVEPRAGAAGAVRAHHLARRHARPRGGRVGRGAAARVGDRPRGGGAEVRRARPRSEEHTSELQSRQYLVCRLLLEKKKKT